MSKLSQSLYHRDSMDGPAIGAHVWWDRIGLKKAYDHYTDMRLVPRNGYCLSVGLVVSLGVWEWSLQYHGYSK